MVLHKFTGINNCLLEVCRGKNSMLTVLHIQLEQVSRGSRIPPASVTALYIK